MVFSQPDHLPNHSSAFLWGILFSVHAYTMRDHKNIVGIKDAGIQLSLWAYFNAKEPNKLKPERLIKKMCECFFARVQFNKTLCNNIFI